MKLRSVNSLMSEVKFDIKVFSRDEEGGFVYIDTVHVNYLYAGEGESNEGIIKLIHLENIGAEVLNIHVNSATHLLEIAVEVKEWG